MHTYKVESDSKVIHELPHELSYQLSIDHHIGEKSHSKYKYNSFHNELYFYHIFPQCISNTLAKPVCVSSAIFYNINLI